MFSSFLSVVDITKAIFNPNTVNLVTEASRNYGICFDHVHIEIKNIGCNSNVTSFESNPRHSMSVFLGILDWLLETHSVLP